MDAAQSLVSAALITAVALFSLLNLELFVAEIRRDLRAAHAAARPAPRSGR